MTLTKVDKGGNDVLHIAEERYDVMDRDSGSLLCLGPCNNIFLFFRTQPMNVGWEVGDKEIGTNTNNDCYYTFEYEYPPPTVIAADTLHIGDSAGK